jgi:hypothetical protein
VLKKLKMGRSNSGMKWSGRHHRGMTWIVAKGMKGWGEGKGLSEYQVGRALELKIWGKKVQRVFEEQQVT